MVDAFEGLMYFNPWLLSLDIILIIAFLYSWRREYKRTGRYIDFWHYTMFMSYFVPVLLMYPFVSSILNVFTVGTSSIFAIQDNTTEAYLVTLTGFGAAYAGKLYYDRVGSIKGLEVVIGVFSSTMGKFFIKAASTQRVITRFALFYIFVLFCFVAFLFSTGLLGNPREFFMLNKGVRPIYIVILSTYELVFLIISTRVLQYDKRLDKILLSTLILFGFFLGVRAPIFLQGLGFSVLYAMIKKRGYVPMLKVGAFMLAALVLIMLFAYVRNNEKGAPVDFAIAIQSLLPEIMYGNTFSDVRDFSWVLGFWDRQHYWGITYFAAMLSFIPSSIYPIRDIYGIGKITVITAGLDPTVHPGLRMGLFGEMYLNFDIIGVIAFGFVWGYVQGRLNALTQAFARSGEAVKASSVLVYSSFISYFTVSAGFWGLYITTFFLFVLYIASRIRLVFK